MAKCKALTGSAVKGLSISKRSDMDHTVLPANYTIPAFLRKRSSDGGTPTEVADTQLQLNLSTSKG